MRRHLKGHKAEPFSLEALGDDNWVEDVMDSYYNCEWSRVKSDKQLTAERVVTFDMLEDVVVDQTSRTMHTLGRAVTGKTLFSLRQFEGEEDSLTVQRHRQSEAQLRKYANMASKVIQGL